MKGRRLLLLPLWLWLLASVALPVAFVAVLSFGTARPGIPPFVLGTDTSNWALLGEDPLYWRAAAASLRLAGLSALLCLLIGYPMALAIARARPSWRSPLLLLVMLPFWTGFLLRVTAWIGVLQEGGWLDAGLGLLGLPAAHLLYTPAAMYLGVTYAYLPFMILPLYARLTRLDPALEEAAADLGAGPATVFRTVTLPQSLPGVWAGLALVAIPAMGEYVIPELLGGPAAQTLGRALWNEFFANRDWPMAASLATALLVVLLAPTVAARLR